MLSCLDYLLAAADYQDFVDLMLEFKDVAQGGIEYDTTEFMNLLVGGPEDDEEDAA